jgi:hypothetical protein
MGRLEDIADVKEGHITMKGFERVMMSSQRVARGHYCWVSSEEGEKEEETGGEY